MIWSASNNVPSFLFSFSTNTWPAVFLVSHKILSAFDVGNDVGSLWFEGSSTCFDGHLNIDSTLNNQRLGTLCGEDSRHFQFNVLGFGDNWLLDWWVWGQQQGSGNNGWESDDEGFWHDVDYLSDNLYNQKHI